MNPAAPAKVSVPTPNVNGDWRIFGGDADGISLTHVTVKGTVFRATCSYTVRGTPYSWVMNGTISQSGEVVVGMTHSYAGKIPYSFKLSPDGKKFIGADIHWERQ